MIPLSRWLEDGAPKAPPGAAPPEEIAQVAAPGVFPVFSEADLEAAYGRGREAAEASAAQALQIMREETQREWAARETSLVAEWSARCSGHISESLAAAIAAMRHEIETAVAGILQPFLGEAAMQRAAEHLVSLLAEEIARPDGALLELRAPAALHAQLSTALERHGIVAVLTESSKVEAVCRTGTRRFESLAGTWVERLAAHES